MGQNQKLPKPGLTIVGGQPREARVDPTSKETEVPVGFEMLLYRASKEPEFREQLLWLWSTKRNADFGTDDAFLAKIAKIKAEAVCIETTDEDEDSMGRMCEDEDVETLFNIVGVKRAHAEL